VRPAPGEQIHCQALLGFQVVLGAQKIIRSHPALIQSGSGVLPGRVGNFRQKNNSAEDGIDGTNDYFRRNSGCSAEQKLSEFRSEPFRGSENKSEFRSVDQKIEVTYQNFVPNPAAEEKKLGIPSCGSKIEVASRNSVPNHSAEEKQLVFRGTKIEASLGMPFQTIPWKRKLKTKRDY
jgi:hypothetical protein